MSLRRLPYSDPGLPDARSGIRLLVWLSRRQLRGQIIATAWGTVYLAGLAVVPVVVGLGIQTLIDGSVRKVAAVGALLLGLGAVQAVSGTFLHRVSVINRVCTAARVHQLLTWKATELGAVLTRRVAAGEVVAVGAGDAGTIGWFVEIIARFASSLVACGALTVLLLIYQPVLGVPVAVAVIVLVVSALPLLPRARRRADELRVKAGRATELASDAVAGLRVLRGIGGEQLFLERYRRASQDMRTAAVRSHRMWALIAAVQVTLPGLFLVFVVWYGVRMVLEGRISVGELVTGYGCVAYLVLPLRLFEETALAYTLSRAAAQRAARVLALSRTDEASGEGGGFPEGDLYDPMTGILAPHGAFTAVVCGDPDEAGRLADRLGGYDQAVAEGGASVLLGGAALDDLPLPAARATVLVQDKDPVLFSGPVRDLLDVPRSERVALETALEIAQCTDILPVLARSVPDPSGDESADAMRAWLTERGRSLSGGQRQRLALARSLISDPPVLVLDEPTSAVDSHTESRIAAGLRHIRRGRTTVVFTSSPLLLDQADRVVFVQQGRSVAADDHRRLLRSDRRYRAVVARDQDDGAAEGGEGADVKGLA